MKKILYIEVAAAATVLAIISCTKVNESDVSVGQEITITASFAENRTKTTLQDGGTQILWEVGDEINVFYDGTGSRFCSTLTAPAATSDFSGSLNFVFGVNDGVGSSKELFAVYPYRPDATSDGTSITTTLPTEQTGKIGSFAKGMNISIARSNSFNMGFYNVCGGVRFSVTRSDVKNVVFESLNGESVAGKVKLGFEGGVPVVREVIEGMKSITLTAPSGGAFEKGSWYYIVAIPGTLSGGFKMTFNTDTKCAVLNSTDSRTLKRGIFGSIANADDGLEYNSKGNIIFQDSIAKVACLGKFDTNHDDEISYEEAAAVTSISGLFANYSSVKSFDELKYFTGITNLSSALKGLTALRSTTIPAGFTSLEASAFDGCSALDSISFAGNSLKTVGDSAFRSCTALEKIEIPSGVTSVGSYCFQGCSSLTSIGLSSDLESIGDYAFSGCDRLGSIDFPSNVSTIGSYAFHSCQSLKSVSVPDAVTSFGTYVFADCSSLESASLPSGLTSIPGGTFFGCTSLCHLTFPKAVTMIRSYAFTYCSFFDRSTGTARIELPSTVTSIGNMALNNARNVLVTSDSFVTIMSDTFSAWTRIFVPDTKVDAYKKRVHWSDLASHIYPLSSYPDVPIEMESVDLGLSVKWAACNIGASKPEEYGTYFAWGDVVGQNRDGSYWSGGGFSEDFSYELDEDGNLTPGYDAAHINLGGTWRMPTETEYEELIDNCISTWTDNYDDTGVSGRIFTSRGNGNSIFLPAAGYGNFGARINATSFGYYRSSTKNSTGTKILYFWSSHTGLIHSHNYSYGQPVRPVTK